jgi:CO dehydrogenase/acetyl-CoA synthase gamma subunit (corrinoid Fe-S protein)
MAAVARLGVATVSGAAVRGIIIPAATTDHAKYIIHAFLRTKRNPTVLVHIFSVNALRRAQLKSQRPLPYAAPRSTWDSVFSRLVIFQSHQLLL